MTDDIVTRLRDLREMLMGNPIMAREVQEAMDEIERLRKSIRHLYFNEGVCYGENCEHCETIYGLVRGE